MKVDGEIFQVTGNKWEYLPLLLLGDEQEALIRNYLGRGEMFALWKEGVAAAVCVVTREEEGVYELQNIAVRPEFCRQGYGRAMIDFIWNHYLDLRVLQLGTGDALTTMSFYQALGFREFRREKDYFLRQYDHPIYEDGKQLKDRICFRKTKAP